MSDHHLDVTPTCPVCLSTLDGVYNPAGPEPPSPGDLTICGYCAAGLTYTDAMDLRRLTTEELDSLAHSATWCRLIDVVHAVIARRLIDG